MSLRHTQGNGFQLNTMADKGKDMYWRFYERQGDGRDNYIAFNNGGTQSKYYAPLKTAYNGLNFNIGNNQAGPRSDVFPAYPGKNINYAQNGTGRDSYVYASNGGFYP